MHMETEKKTTKKKLSPRRAKFAKAYAENGNASESARQAGYKAPETTGHRLTKDVQVLEAVESWEEYLQGQIRPSLNTLEKLRDNDESSAIKLKSAETLLKMAGVGQQKQAISAVNIFTSMSDDDLIAKLTDSVQEKLPNPSEE